MKCPVFKIWFLFTFSLSLFSCAGVRIYSDIGLQKPAALEFHYAKPFLMVERNASKDVPLKSSIIYLPDLEHTFYVKPVKGLGSSDLKIAYENGHIASFGLTTDSKIPETITSLAGLITARGAVQDEGQAKASVELYEIVIISNIYSLKRVAKR